MAFLIGAMGSHSELPILNSAYIGSSFIAAVGGCLPVYNFIDIARDYYEGEKGCMLSY